MRKTSLVDLAASLALCLAIATGCSSSATSGGAPPSSLSCSATIAGASVCFTYVNLTASQLSTTATSCTTSLGGTVVTACPTVNVVGCCHYTTANEPVTACIYCGPPAEVALTCASSPTVQNPTWTAGSGGPASCGAVDAADAATSD